MGIMCDIRNGAKWAKKGNVLRVEKTAGRAVGFWAKVLIISKKRKEGEDVKNQVRTAKVTRYNQL